MSENGARRAYPTDATHTPAGQWPRCVPLGGRCFVYEMSQTLGADVFLEFVEFLTKAETGTMITLKRNDNGITAQVTGPVRHSSSKILTVAEVQQLTPVAAENMLARQSREEKERARRKSGGSPQRRPRT